MDSVSAKLLILLPPAILLIELALFTTLNFFELNWYDYPLSLSYFRYLMVESLCFHLPLLYLAEDLLKSSSSLESKSSDSVSKIDFNFFNLCY